VTVRVLVVDDHPFYREGVIVSLSAFDTDIQIVGSSADGAEAVAAVPNLNPDVVLMDLTMPGMSGIEAIREISRTSPDVAVLVLTMSDDESVFAALRAGARGYLLKQATVDELSRAIHAVHRGEGIFSRSVIDRLRGHFATIATGDLTVFPTLSPRERTILVLLAEGRSNQRIADDLGLRAKTVRNYVANIFTKLDVHDREHAARAARDAGFV
jgi:DNA-binding NarL/FixJ family response regulator